ncbi:hypothetical protein CDD83_9178 [Cordyceps sp. RAO-2017]|nr:hypothetical protein CDD83_9178 [Cordyceps sp. RAO-2017]
MGGPGEPGQDAPPEPPTTDQEAQDEVRFTPQEEADLVRESHAIKAEANALFSSQDFQNALSRYEDAIESCPKYLYFERAVLHSNIAAAHLKLEQWAEAIKAATKALDALAELAKEHPADEDSNDMSGNNEAAGTSTHGDQGSPKGTPVAPEEAIEEEIVSSGALRSAPAPPPDPKTQSPAEARTADILRIRTKALLRRARARSEAGGWQNLAGAEEDYRTLAGMPGLGPADMRTVRAQLKSLPPRTKAAQESEMSEMWGKLRQLGDGILRPFGLSTQNFQMVKDEKTGGYSVNFSQDGGGGESSKPS